MDSEKNWWVVSFYEDGTICTADECGPYRIAAWSFGNREFNGRRRWAVMTASEYRNIQAEDDMRYFWGDAQYFGLKTA